MACRRKMSAGECSQPSSMNSAMLFSPSPSMSSAPRLTKCRSRSNRCAGQISPPVQRTSTSPSSATASDPHIGAMVGEDVGLARLVAGEVLDHLRDHVAGALDATRSPMRRPSRAISSRLWSVTLATITPPTPTGFSRPTGVSLPVRPTWISIASSVVSAFSAGNLCASPSAARARRSRAAPASRAGRPCRPRRRCRTAGRRALPRSRDIGRASRRCRRSGRAGR